MTTPSAWRLTTLGHSCVLVEIPAANSPVRMLLDPGNLTPPLENIGAVDALLITHMHPDHVDSEQVRRARATSSAPVYGPQSAMDLLADGGLEDLHTVRSGEVLSIASVDVVVNATQHAPIYRGIPLPENIAYRIGARLYAPGDSFAPVDAPVDVLLLPLAGPWMKLAETVDYLRTVMPKVAVLVHDAGLADPHRELHRGVVTRFAPEGTRILAPGVNQTVEV